MGSGGSRCKSHFAKNILQRNAPGSTHQEQDTLCDAPDHLAQLLQPCDALSRRRRAMLSVPELDPEGFGALVAIEQSGAENHRGRAGAFESAGRDEGPLRFRKTPVASAFSSAYGSDQIRSIRPSA